MLAKLLLPASSVIKRLRWKSGVCIAESNQTAEILQIICIQVNRAGAWTVKIAEAKENKFYREWLPCGAKYRHDRPCLLAAGQ